MPKVSYYLKAAALPPRQTGKAVAHPAGCLPLARMKQDGPETREALRPPPAMRDKEKPADKAPTPTVLLRVCPEAAKNERPYRW